MERTQKNLLENKMKNYKMGSDRNFGLVFFVFFIILASYPLLNNQSLNFYLLGTGLIFLVLGVLNSKILTPLNILWTKFGVYLGKIISPVVMFVIYFGVVFPTKVILMICKKDILNLDFKNKSLKNDSYWNLRKEKITKMKNQF